MAKSKDDVKIISVPVDKALNQELNDEAKREERSLADTCRRLWREGLRARHGKKQLAAAK